MRKIVYYIKKNKENILFLFFLFLILSVLVIYVDDIFDEISCPVWMDKAVIEGVLFILLIGLLIILRTREKILMTIILGGLLCAYMWLCPLGVAPDEENHFLRAYEVANVSLVSENMGEEGGGNYLPETIRSYGDANASINAKPGRFTYCNTALYSPVTYLPQSIGIKIGGLFTDKVSGLFYAGKYANALTSFILCISAIWIVPFGRKILFIIMTFPVTLQEMVSISPDGFVISLSLFWLAFILYLAYKAEKINYYHVGAMTGLATILSLCKIIYVVLVLLIFMVPNKKFNNIKKGRYFKLGLIGVACLFNMIWLKIASGFLIEFNPGVNTSEQVIYIITNLGEFYKILLRTLIHYSIDWIGNMIGSNMGALDINVLPMVWFCFAALFVYEICSEKAICQKPHKYDPLLLIMTFLFGCVLIFTSLYVQWNPLKNEIIDGIQGRYFTPLLGTAAYFAVFMRQKKFINTDYVKNVRKCGTYMYIIVLFCSGTALLDMIKYYIAE